MAIKKGLYQHYKGPMYKVLDVAKHSETEESLVVYQPLYGDKSMWVRPLTMFAESVELNGQSQPRFKYVEPQTEVREVAVLNVKHGQQNAFEAAFEQAEPIITSMAGYIKHSLSRCVEDPQRYLLLVGWQTIEDHEQGFRQSREYEQWKSLLHHFYDPFPTVEHYTEITS